ncbi:hypothetical protein H8356DRAFT_1081869 [Neocallimastix lanati (nom. inval.)]|uniref:Uncharacterized protein n=1 Tax=Neocallimastix californiae TaxID=1754190 RepID=A0A1Y2ACD3_9FUNG|nr:hypothetical protein H8356DRAFT_1081869 [Neocallimastix sp. JGI-2020a]ORY20223.1 hypothetical protein LY90DRAFT_516953 [Neocallimastix californiae]|eukprot:ORY20223.1 hypothetical protein LY90DRAFT_516953 [Neocallimastix californiae]
MYENLKIEFSETNRRKEQVIINRKFKFNFSTLKKIIQKHIDALNTKQKINFISNFPFINFEYINDIYNKIKSECLEQRYDNFLELLEYFEITYLKDYEIKYWNYYDNIEHLTNNASESFDNY